MILPPACPGSLPGSESASAKAQTSPQASCSDEPSLPATSHCLALSCRNMPCHVTILYEMGHVKKKFTFPVPSLLISTDHHVGQEWPGSMEHLLPQDYGDLE